MAGYDHTGTLTLSSMNVAQHDILRLTAPESGPMNLNRMDAFDQDLNFDGGDLLSRDDVNNSLPSLPFTPSYEFSDAFSTTFEDPFSSYQSGPFESLLDDTTAAQNGESNSTDTNPDNKLLGFGTPILKAAVLDDNGQTWPAMSAELYGMFFVAEDVFGGETGRPLELTCYRRNLFQISGSVTLSRSIAHMVNEQGQQVPIYDLTATISALESIEGKSTEIISVPWKTSTVSTSEDKAGAAPPKWPLDLSMNPELDPTCVSIPIAWKRLQFKHATANNGRRKGLQQHYVIQINLLATLATGESVKIAEIQSGPIIVRGRSPRNFDSRKDVPLSERKLDSKPRTMSDAGPPAVKPDPNAAASNNSYRFYALNQLQQPLDLPDWSQTSQTPLISPSLESPLRASKKPLISPSQPPRPPIPKTKWKTEPSSSKPAHISNSASAPIDLSLADDDYGKGGRGLGRGSSAESPETGGPMSDKRKGLGGSPVENVELLYEYFPLSLDDWMPPVDAIYRPHVVHHTIVPPDLKALQVKNKTKRYFSADD